MLDGMNRRRLAECKDWNLFSGYWGIIELFDH